MSSRERFKNMQGRSGDEAGFYWQGGPLEVAERTYFQSRFSGVTAFDTDEGIVLIDSGLGQLGPKLAGMLRQKTSAPIHSFVITHGHVDHGYGIEAFLVPGQRRPRVIAHRAMPARYELTTLQCCNQCSSVWRQSGACRRGRGIRQLSSSAFDARHIV